MNNMSISIDGLIYTRYYIQDDILSFRLLLKLSSLIKLESSLFNPFHHLGRPTNMTSSPLRLIEDELIT